MDIDAAVWSTAMVNNLPDSSFALIEPGGEKDDEGKTKPRSLRHLPYKDASGKVDLPHLRNALARCSQMSVSQDMKDKARRKLENAAREAGVGDHGMMTNAASAIDPAEHLLETVQELQAVGKMISRKNLQTLRDAHAIIGNLIMAAESMESAKVYFDGDTLSFGGGN